MFEDFSASSFHFNVQILVLFAPLFFLPLYGLSINVLKSEFVLIVVSLSA